MSFLAQVFALMLAYAVWAAAAQVLTARMKLLSVAHAAVGGSGAYAFAACAAGGFPFGASVVASLLASAAVGALLVVAAERVTEDRYVLLTFAVQLVWLSLVINLTGATGGVLGLRGLPDLPLSESLGRTVSSLAWCLALAALAGGIASALARGPFSWACSVVARGSELAKTLGISPLLTRVQVGIVYGSLCGGAAVSIASLVGFISPESFSSDQSVLILAIGYFGSDRVSLTLGSALLVGLPEFARLLGLSSAQSGYLRLLLGGAAVFLAPTVFMRASIARKAAA